MNDLRVRKDLLKIDKIELQALNDGFEALVAVEGRGGYQSIAGIYGKPFGPHRPKDPLLFLPWHRAYLLTFEQACDRFVADLSLPYWNWVDEDAWTRGIPGRLRKVAYADKDEGVWLNAFYRAPIDFLGHEYYTERSPHPAGELKPIAQKILEGANQPRYEVFASAAAEASRQLRLWVGGHMVDEDLASYDPLFWFHHSFLDRIWWEWRKVHVELALADSLLDTELAPFGVTVRDVLDTDRSIYTYDDGASRLVQAEAEEENLNIAPCGAQL